MNTKSFIKVFCYFVFAFTITWPSILELKAEGSNSVNTPGGISEAEFDVKEVAHFDLGDRRYAVWASIRNDTTKSPSEWQFLVEPLLQPVRHNLIPDAKVNGNVVSFELALWNDVAMERALKALKATFPDKAENIVPTNIRLIPINVIQFDTSDIASYDSGAVLDPAVVPIGNGSPKYIGIRIRASTPTKASDIASALPSFIINYKMFLSARITLQAAARIEGVGNMIAGFKSSLDGISPTTNGVKYVQRLDFRKYLASRKDQITSSVRVDRGSVADSEGLFKNAFETFMRRWDSLTAQSFQQLDAYSTESTFNKNDLTPDRVTEEINKLWTYDSGTHSFKVNVSGNTGGNVSIGPISAGGKLSGNYSKEEVDQWLKQNDIDAEFKGDKWIAKDVKVRQINDTSLGSLSSEVTSFTEVLPIETKIQTGRIEYSQATTDGVETIEGRITNVERGLETYQTLPIGTILPYYGDTNALKNTGWVLCDLKNSTMYPQQVPNLENRFLEGIGKDSIGKIGGVDKLPSDGAFTPAGSVTSYKNPNNRNGTIGWQGEGKECMAASTSFSGVAVPAHNHGGEIRPLFFTVYYIIRIK